MSAGPGISPHRPTPVPQSPPASGPPALHIPLHPCGSRYVAVRASHALLQPGSGRPSDTDLLDKQLSLFPDRVRVQGTQRHKGTYRWSQVQSRTSMRRAKGPGGGGSSWGPGRQQVGGSPGVGEPRRKGILLSTRGDLGPALPRGAGTTACLHGCPSQSAGIPNSLTLCWMLEARGGMTEARVGHSGPAAMFHAQLRKGLRATRPRHGRGKAQARTPCVVQLRRLLGEAFPPPPSPSTSVLCSLSRLWILSASPDAHRSPNPFSVCSIPRGTRRPLQVGLCCLLRAGSDVQVRAAGLSPAPGLPYCP